MELRCVPLFLLQLLLLLLSISASSETIVSPLPSCEKKCGDVNITYPFGIGAGCYLDAGFAIRCVNDTKAYFGDTNIEVKAILPDHVRANYIYISYECYGQTGVQINGSTAWFNLTQIPPLRFSDTRNKFTVIGCDTLAYIFGRNSHDQYEYISGCVSYCITPESATSGSCSGLGCCQTSIPKDLVYFNASFDGYNHSYNDIWKFSPCSYGMLIDQDSYQFAPSDLPGFEFYNKRNITGFPIVVDWAIRNASSCSDAEHKPNYACRSGHSNCYESTNGPGYLCNCSAGYEGNPYLEDGCKDIDECQNPANNSCYGVCSNKAGGYDCKCPPGTRGNPMVGPCSEKFPLVAKLSVGISAGVIILLALSFFTVIELQKRRYFKLNGGQRLQEEMRRRQVETFRFLTKKELMKATNNFDRNRIIGTGGRGEVYRGILEEDNKEVAIKKSKEVDVRQKDEFVNEIIILFQINHRSVVRILGCCFEMHVPMLVYEFVPNGTLFHFLHGKNRASPISLDIRLDIAIDSAEALAYLHSSTSRSILHGDVKSLNILLDANYKAKVSDFGASALVPLDKDQFITLVQGTRGYLDPECLSTQQLTEKSDVYSFGVILLELITRKEAIYTDDSNGQTKSLTLSFVSMKDQGRLHDILDNQIVAEGTIEVLQEIAELAMRCLSIKSEERPTMKEVADVLHILGRSKHHPWGQKNPEEIESLLGHEISAYSTSADTTAYNTVGNRLALNIDDGR